MSTLTTYVPPDGQTVRCGRRGCVGRFAVRDPGGDRWRWWSRRWHLERGAWRVSPAMAQTLKQHPRGVTWGGTVPPEVERVVCWACGFVQQWGRL